MNTSIDHLLNVASSLGWKYERRAIICDDASYVKFRRELKEGVFEMNIRSCIPGWKESPSALIINLRKFYEEYNPEYNVQLRLRNEHILKGNYDVSEKDLLDVENDIKQSIKTLLESMETAEGVSHGETTFSFYRIVRIDGRYNPAKTSYEDALDTAVHKVIFDAQSHMHTIEQGVQITDITDCGESL